MNNKLTRWFHPLNLALGIAVITTLTGCVGYVDGGGGEVVAGGPDVTIFGGGFERGRDVHVYSHRGFESRGGRGGFHGGGHGRR